EEPGDERRLSRRRARIARRHRPAAAPRRGRLRVHGAQKRQGDCDARGEHQAHVDERRSFTFASSRVTPASTWKPPFRKVPSTLKPLSLRMSETVIWSGKLLPPSLYSAGHFFESPP